jgi:hypothetical protein
MRLAGWVLLLALVSPVAAPAADTVPAEVSPEAKQRSEEFLKLPAYGVDRVESEPGSQPLTTPQPHRVGDVLVFKVMGLNIPGIARPGVDLKVTVPDDDVVDQGWGLVEAGEKRDDELRFALGIFKAGKVEVPSLLISAADGRALGRTQPFELQVESAIAADDQKPQEPAEPRPPVSLRFPWLILALSALLVLLVAGLLIFALVRWLDSRKPKAAIALPPTPSRPEDEVALEALSELEKKDYCRSRKFKPHYFGVSEILKTYVGGRYRFDAAESTSSELLATLRDEKGVGEDVLREIRDLFGRLDFVKFTDHVPEETEGSQLLDRARKLVLLTRRPKVQLTPEPELKSGGEAARAP